MKKRVADIVMETLLEYDIDTCFAVVGGGAMHLDNALLLAHKMNKYFQHHEQACAMSAEAFARFSGRMAAVCVTTGPGAVNTLTGVLGSWQDSIPMIILSGQVRYEISIEKSGLPLRYRGIQEFEIVPTVKNMTKYACMITNPLTIRQELGKAIQIARSGRKGPVWLDIPQDIQNTIVEEEDLYPIESCFQEFTIPAMEEIIDLFEKLKLAERPCILAGSGIISGNARDEFSSFVERMGMPVLGGTWVADNFYTDHPLYYGSSGSVGPRTGNFILQNADVILAIGNSLGFRQTGFNQEGFAPNAKIYMVDADKYEAIKPGLRVESLILSDVKSFFRSVEKLDTQIQPKLTWIKFCNRLKEKFTPFEAVEEIKQTDRVCSYYFWKIFRKYESNDSILALGNNTANTAKMQIGVQHKAQRVLINYTCGSMGYDLPAAIGAAVAAKKQVICVTGDGSIMMNLQEMQTIVQYDLPIHLVVFANDGYAAIRQTCKNFFGGAYIGCTPDSGVSFPEFSKIADTFGFRYVCCESNAKVDECLQEMFSSEGRVLLEVLQRFDDPVIPKIMSHLDEQGKMQTPVLQDMYPFLSKEEMDEISLWLE